MFGRVLFLTEIWFNSSSIFGMWSLILIQMSFNFLESNAIFTDLSLFTVITTGDTKQSSSTLLIFRSRKKCSTTYAIVLFFFSRPFHEKFKFLKNCPYGFHEILHSHFTPKGAPACAKASKSYGWDVRNIAKISPKMAKKQSFFDFFRFSQKLSIRFERNFLQLFYTILESYMCNGIKIIWLGCEKHSQT